MSNRHSVFRASLASAVSQKIAAQNNPNVKEHISGWHILLPFSLISFYSFICEIGHFSHFSAETNLGRSIETLPSLSLLICMEQLIVFSQECYSEKNMS